MSDRPSVIVCRGCCCGRRGNGSDPASESFLRHLRSALYELGIRVSVSQGCLGPCDRHDVVVVRPAPGARSRGASAIWLGWCSGESLIDDLVGFLAAGGPGRADVPDGLDLHSFSAPRTTRAARGR
jgi:hypothetical protein